MRAQPDLRWLNNSLTQEPCAKRYVTFFEAPTSEPLYVLRVSKTSQPAIEFALVQEPGTGKPLEIYCSGSNASILQETLANLQSRPKNTNNKAELCFRNIERSVIPGVQTVSTRINPNTVPHFKAPLKKLIAIINELEANS